MRVVYIDVLFFCNFLADLIVLKLVSRISKRNSSILRLVLAAALGGGYACFNFFCDLPVILCGILNMLVLLLICFAAFRFYGLLDGLKLCALTFSTAFGMGGGVMGLYFLLGDGERFRLSNGTFYIEFSLLQLLIFSALIYAILEFSYSLFLKIRAGERTVEVEIHYFGRSLRTLALLDTGNKLRDVVTGKKVAVIDRAELAKLTTIDKIKEEHPERYRILPTITAGGEGQLEAFRPDSIQVFDDGRIFSCEMLIAVSDTIKADYKMVLCNDAAY